MQDVYKNYDYVARCYVQSSKRQEYINGQSGYGPISGTWSPSFAKLAMVQQADEEGWARELRSQVVFAVKQHLMSVRGDAGALTDCDPASFLPTDAEWLEYTREKAWEYRQATQWRKQLPKPAGMLTHEEIWSLSIPELRQRVRSVDWAKATKAVPKPDFEDFFSSQKPVSEQIHDAVREARKAHVAMPAEIKEEPGDDITIDGITFKSMDYHHRNPIGKRQFERTQREGSGMHRKAHDSTLSPLSRRMAGERDEDDAGPR